MMDKELEAEIHPLKHDDKTSQRNLENRTEKDDLFKKASRHSQFAQCRTVLFFFSLFTCLFVVFIISFIIPCPDRPISQKMWKINYERAVTYDFMMFKDINKDRVQDVLFLHKDGGSSSNGFNRSCTDEGFSSPCTFLAAVSGTNGSLLWDRPVAQDIAFIECVGPQGMDEPPWSCFIVGKPRSLIAVNSSTGETLWNQSDTFGGNASVLRPFLNIPDVNGDEIQDLLLFTKSGGEIQSYIFSGNTGDQIGSTHSLNLEGEVGYIMHVTKIGAYYVIFHSASSLYGYSLKELYEEMTGKRSIFEEDPYMKKIIDNVTHRMPPFHSSGAIRYLMNIPAKNDIFLVKSDACEMLDGQKLTTKWTFNASEVVRKPVLGYYKPDALAIVLENGTDVQRKISIVDIASGVLLWSLPLSLMPRSPKTATMQTADRRSVFFFWGSSKVTGPNQTETVDFQQNVYMFHPTLPDSLLEIANFTQNIVAFDVVIFEENHHASYVLLTGPTNQDQPGQVSLSKQKVKENILNSKVIWLIKAKPDSDQTIKDRFYELRYRREK
ncbi:protein FAM234A [Gracilinanus agilis]|uniref:protein FAM234A n=1 Tax=Gracilinanus agilis TaxID=191870 RepID=UPI001CFEBF27|nr:protein FAM234A [Gracilinanus agilis]